MGLATMLSRLLGMVREMVYASFMGDGPVASAFKVAFMVPNLFRRLLGEGALTAAFIPIFKEKEKNAGEKEMWRSANAVICGLLIATIGLSVLAVVGIGIALAKYPFVWKTYLMLKLLQIMFPYVILVCLAAVLMAMLNARGHFFVPAMGATLLNVVMIATVLFWAPGFGPTIASQIFALAFGVLIAGMAQAAFQVPTLRKEGFRFEWVTPWHDPTVREVLKKMAPGTLGVAAFQINVLVTQGVALQIDDSINASFDYAVRLMELPQGVFGISLATYLLPTLSGLAVEKKFKEFCATYRQGFNYLLFVNLLASALLVVLAEPIVRLLFERGAFDGASTERAAFALAWLAPGLAAFSAVNITARAFYALGDTKTPMHISIASLALNLVIALWFVGPFRQGGLAAANTISACGNLALLMYGLRRALRGLEARLLLAPALSMAGAAIVAAAVAWGVLSVWQSRIGHDALWSKLGEVFVPMTVASLCYWAVAKWQKIPAADEAWGLIRTKLLRRKD